MFGIGETELVLILLFAFMIFGPDKLPGMGKTLGRALRQFRTAQEGFTQVVQTEIVDPATEAMSDKKPNRSRVEFDEDADIEGGEAAAPAKKTETFAERKKRLEAERKAKEAAEKEAADAQAAASASEDADTDAAPADAPASELSASTTEAEPAAPKKPSVADLYTMKRPAAKPEPEERQPEAGEAVAEDLGASHEVSEERSDERRAAENLGDGLPGPAADAPADTTEKEA